MKTLYSNSIHTLLVVLTFVLLASSCSKKSEPDPLDQYTGTWTISTLNGQPNSGTSLLLSDYTPSGNFTASLNGSGFQADNKNIATGAAFTFPDRSYGQIYLQNLTGSLSGSNLTLNYTYYVQSPTLYDKVYITAVFTKK